MPLRVYHGFVGRLTLESREYAVLKTAVIDASSPSNNTVKILCDYADAQLLLNRATEFYTEAMPFIRLGFNTCA